MKTYVNLYLLHPEREQGTIACYFRANSKTIVFNTGEKIEAKYWDVKRQKVKKNYRSASDINLLLENFVTQLEDYIREYQINKKNPSYNNLIEYIKMKVEGVKQDFFSLLNSFIDDLIAKKKTNKVKKFQTIKRHLICFEKTEKHNLELEDIDQFTFERFFTYLQNQNFSNNYINKLIALWRNFMEWAYEAEKTNNDRWKRYRSVANTSFPKMSLTSDEVKAIENLNLTEHLCLDRTRDLFLFQLYTAQRFSDVHAFNIEDVKGNIWNFVQQKTDIHVSVALIQKALNILQKYNYQLPKISNQKMNEYLKIIGLWAGLTDIYNEINVIGGVRVEKRVPKYQLLQTHTARRTAITLLNNCNTNISIVKTISGHTTDAMVHRYYSPSDNDAQLNALEMAYN